MASNNKKHTDEIGWYQGRVVLNWTGHKAVARHSRDCKFCGTWDNQSARRPRPDPCRFCGKTAHLRDDQGPVHKTCLEGHLTRELDGQRPRHRQEDR